MRHIVVGTAGHIDHGKSALVQALTGTDPDRLKEEKERGITIELGFAHYTAGDLTVAFVDAPGHERFVKTMLAGVGGLDCVLLVIAADESVMPQTREHFDICRLLRVQLGMVVLTKVDLVDDETLEIVRLEARELVKESFLEHAPVVAVSARTGAGLDQLRDGLAAIATRVTHRGQDGAARLPIDRAFSMQGFGTVVTGTLGAGRIRVDDELALVPGRRGVRVRGVQVHGKRRDEALSGQRTALNLGGIDLADIARGQSLISPGSLTVTRRVDATIDLLPAARPLKHGTRVRFHQGTSEVLGRISIAGGTTTELRPGARAGVRLRLESPAALTRGDRFIVRAYSPTITIGGGEVLDPDPPRTGVRTSHALTRFTALSAGVTRAVAQMIDDAGDAGLPVDALSSRAGITVTERPALVLSLESSGDARRAADLLVSPEVIRDRSRRLLGLVSDFHKAHPLVDGIPREEARERVFARAHPAVFEFILSELSAAKQLVVRDRLSLPGHRLELSPDEARAHEVVAAAFKRGGLQPPDPKTIASGGNIAPALAEQMTALLLRQKVLVRIESLIFHADALTQLKAEIRALKEAAGARATVDVATFKDRYGVTRKFAIPLLEWLDRERVTRRQGDTRVVL